MGQIGKYQDCTMLVTNSLAAVGIYFHGWPWQYQPALGYYIPAAQAQPGDLIYYADGGAGLAHIAIYIGNGMAVHGGYNGNQTVVFTAYVGSGPVFLRLN
jgi:cell wall-associated NlpC family hydrolase